MLHPNAQPPMAGQDAVPAAGAPTDILSLATSTSPWSPAVHLAASLAARWGSQLTGCYVDASLWSVHDPEYEPTVLSLLLDTPAQDTKEAAAFRAFAHERGVPHASWVVARTGVPRMLRQLCAWHSMAVLERATVEMDALAELLGEALLTCRLPSLVLPPGWERPSRFSRVLLAWDGSVEAVRAIHAALPFLRDAKRVFLLDGGRRRVEEGNAYSPPFEPFLYLARHEIEVDPLCVGLPSRTAGAALLKKVEQMGVDLVVMGASGHVRLHGRVLGGATCYVLKRADVPVLLQH